MADRSWITVFIPTPLIFRYHLPLSYCTIPILYFFFFSLLGRVLRTRDYSLLDHIYENKQKFCLSSRNRGKNENSNMNWLYFLEPEIIYCSSLLNNNSLSANAYLVSVKLILQASVGSSYSVIKLSFLFQCFYSRRKHVIFSERPRDSRKKNNKRYS